MTNLDVKAIASRLGTEGRIFRRYLRSDASSFKPVGTGKQYRFRELDFPTLEAEFKAYQNRSSKTSTPKPRKKTSTAPTVTLPVVDVDSITPEEQELLDLQVWEEEEKELADEGRPSVAQQMRMWNTDEGFRRERMAEMIAQEKRLKAAMISAGLRMKKVQ